MATDTNETSTGDERDEGASSSNDGGADQRSQKEMADDTRAAQAQQEKESKKKAGSIILVASVLLAIIALVCLYLADTVQGNHPLAQQALYVLGALNLVLALAVYIRKNWPRALVLTAMPLTIIGVLLNLTLISTAKYLVMVLCLVEIYVMFRQPILDEFDAPKE